MKEAAGEANMTVITIVLIGVVAAVGAILIPRLMKTVKKKNCCVAAGYYISGNKCCRDNDTTVCGRRYDMNNSAFTTASPFSACME